MGVRILAIAFVAALATGSRAQVVDHLKCYNVKDPAVKALYTADLQGLIPEPGCQIKVPAKLVCVPTPKTNVQPEPPNPKVEGGPATMMVCYKAKCAKAVLPPVPVEDQFGTRTLTAKTAKLLCAPVPLPPTPTTTVPAPTSTTATPTSSTTTTTAPLACHDSSYPTCGGACPAGQDCVAQRIQCVDFVSGEVEIFGTFCRCADPVVPCSGDCTAGLGHCPDGQVCVSGGYCDFPVCGRGCSQQ